jgi:hypothetical protein
MSAEGSEQLSFKISSATGMAAVPVMYNCKETEIEEGKFSKAGARLSAINSI